MKWLKHNNHNDNTQVSLSKCERKILSSVSTFIHFCTFTSCLVFCPLYFLRVICMWNIWRASDLSSHFVCREGAGPLHCGSEPLGHAGAGLPDDQAKPDAGGGHQNGEGPPRRDPQPRVPPSAQRPGRHPEGEPQDVNAELKTYNRGGSWCRGRDARASRK